MQFKTLFKTFFPIRPRTILPRELFVVLSGPQANPSRPLSQLATGFEEIKNEEEKAKKAEQAAPAQADKENNTQGSNTSTTAAPANRPASSPARGQGAPQPPTRKATPITFFIEKHNVPAQDKAKVAVPTYLALQIMSAKLEAAYANKAQTREAPAACAPVNKKPVDEKQSVDDDDRDYNANQPPIDRGPLWENLCLHDQLPINRGPLWEKRSRS